MKFVASLFFCTLVGAAAFLGAHWRTDHWYRDLRKAAFAPQPDASSLPPSLNAIRFSLQRMGSEPWLRSGSSSGWPGSQPDRTAGLPRCLEDLSGAARKLSSKSASMIG